MDDLCRQYYYPLYCYIRRRGLNHQDAQDILHDFLSKLIQADTFRKADGERGRLRALLCTSLQRFLYNRFRDEGARKRALELRNEQEITLAGKRFRYEVAIHDETPECAFDRKWAHELLNTVRSRLLRRYQSRGKSGLHEVLEPVLLAGGSLRGWDLSAMARMLDMTEGALRVALSRMLAEYGAILREELLQTVADPEDVESELAYLIEILRPGRGSH